MGGDLDRRTGFSREDAHGDAINYGVSRMTLSRLKPVLLTSHASREIGGDLDRRTGFSREDAHVDAINFGVSRMTLSRLKPVLRNIPCVQRNRR